MKREVCLVKQLQEDAFLLENTKEEYYCVDLGRLGTLKAEDYAMLVYSDRHPGENGVFIPDIIDLYPLDLRVIHPC